MQNGKGRSVDYWVGILTLCYGSAAAQAYLNHALVRLYSLVQVVSTFFFYLKIQRAIKCQLFEGKTYNYLTLIIYVILYVTYDRYNAI